MQCDYLVFLGRFQPFHNGHRRVVQAALDKNPHKVIVGIGSANRARSMRNPWTFEERSQMIKESFGNSDQIITVPINDYLYNDQRWIAQVQEQVSAVILKDMNTRLGSPHVNLHGLRDAKIGLIGLKKDASSYYLKLFPEWESFNVPQATVFNATDIRRDYFTANPHLPHNISEGTQRFLRDFMETPEFFSLVRENEWEKSYRTLWSGAPFPPVFVTVDTVVIQSGHILLIRRGGFPGKGQLALPGGFLNQEEYLEEAAVRELKEETDLSDHKGPMPPAMLRSFIDGSRVFDAPHRSGRGRTITHAYLFRLPNATSLYTVKGSDDADHAEWVPLGEVHQRASEFFEDHYDIIMEMTGV